MFIRMYRNFLTPETCESLIKKFEEADFNHVEHDAADFYDLNIAEEKWQETDWLLIKFQELIEIYQNSLQLDVDKQWPVDREWEHFRIKKYNQGKQQFRLHTDNAANRILAFFVYLNDVEEGGETNFPIHRAKITPEQGSAVVFPTTWEYLHEGKTPISSDKYILSGYLRGKNAAN